MRLTAAIAITLAMFAGAVLGLTPKERQTAEHARAGVQAGIEHNNLLGQQLGAANQSASDSAQSAQLTETRAQTAEKQAKDQHDELVRAAKENAAMRPIVKEVQSWWGIGGIIYGFKRLAVHLLILTAVLIVIGILLVVLAPTVVIPGLKVAFSSAVVFLEAAEKVIGALWARVLGLFQRAPVPSVILPTWFGAGVVAPASNVSQPVVQPVTGTITQSVEADVAKIDSIRAATVQPTKRKPHVVAKKKSPKKTRNRNRTRTRTRHAAGSDAAFSRRH